VGEVSDAYQCDTCHELYAGRAPFNEDSATVSPLIEKGGSKRWPDVTISYRLTLTRNPTPHVCPRCVTKIVQKWAERRGDSR